MVDFDDERRGRRTRVDRWAEERALNRSDAIRALISEGLKK